MTVFVSVYEVIHEAPVVQAMNNNISLDSMHTLYYELQRKQLRYPLDDSADISIFETTGACGLQLPVSQNSPTNPSIQRQIDVRYLQFGKQVPPFRHGESTHRRVCKNKVIFINLLLIIISSKTRCNFSFVLKSWSSYCVWQCEICYV